MTEEHRGLRLHYVPRMRTRRGFFPGRRWRAGCMCGWRGPGRRAQVRAFRDFARHADHVGAEGAFIDLA